MRNWHIPGGTRGALLAIAGVAVVAVVLVLLLSGGHGSHASATDVPQKPVASTPAAKDPAVEESLRHGWMVVVLDEPSSDPYAEQNASVARGVSLAVDELNKAGGFLGHVRIKLLRQKLDGLSAHVVQSRLRSDAAVAVVLPCDTDSEQGLAAAAAGSGSLVLAPCNPEPQAGRRYAMYWPVGMGGTEEATGLVDFMRKIGYGTVFIVGAKGSHYAELLTNDFRNAAQRAGIQVVGNYTTALGYANLSAAVGAIKGANPAPSTVFTVLPPPAVNRLAAELRNAGVTAPVLGTTTMDTQATLASKPGAAEEAFLASYGFARERPGRHKPSPAVRFAHAYKAMYGSRPVGSFPGLGYETVQLLETASNAAHSGLPSAIQQALSKGLTLNGFALAERTYKPGTDHAPATRMGIEKVVSQQLEPVSAQEVSPEG
jgi:ABC-type branched-subunit amino acid transport system substrate-binding protein